MSILGTRVVRTEDPRLLTAGGTYVDDLRVPELLGAARATFIRSPVAHALIAGLDLSAARAAPGVVAVFTARDLDDLPPPPPDDGTGSEGAPIPIDMPATPPRIWAVMSAAGRPGRTGPGDRGPTRRRRASGDGAVRERLGGDRAAPDGGDRGGGQQPHPDADRALIHVERGLVDVEVLAGPRDAGAQPGQ